MEALNKSIALQMIYPDFHANLNKRNKKTLTFYKKMESQSILQPRKQLLIVERVKAKTFCQIKTISYLKAKNQLSNHGSFERLANHHLGCAMCKR